MRRVRGALRNSLVIMVLVLDGIVVSAPAKTKKGSSLPKLFCQAPYVDVETHEGDINPEIAHKYPVDYDAAVGVQQRMQKLGRYILAYEQQQADLVMVVWKARPEEGRLPGQPTQMPPVSVPQMPDPGTGPNPGQNPGNPRGAPSENSGGMGGPDGVGISHGGRGIAAYPTNDQLAVYQPGDQNQQAPLWKKSEKDGLKEPNMPLFRQLADAVGDACPNASR